VTIAHSGDARVVVYSRPGCHLCEVAEAQIAEICAETGDTWARVDITTDDDLTSRFTDQVPVIFLDGAQHDFWRVDPVRLRKALARTS
jgi:glutaredoxin